MAHRNRVRARVLAAALAASVLGTASSALAEESRPVVSAPRPEGSGPDALLVTTGAVMFGLPYGTSIAAGAISNTSADHWLYLPVVGPFGAVIARATCETPGCKGDLGSSPLPLVLDGLMQGAGMYILARALLTPAAPSTPPSGAEVHVVPTTYAGGGGLAAFGKF